MSLFQDVFVPITIGDILHNARPLAPLPAENVLVQTEAERFPNGLARLAGRQPHGAGFRDPPLVETDPRARRSRETAFRRGAPREVAQMAGDAGVRPGLGGPDGARCPFPEGRPLFLQAGGGRPPMPDSVFLQFKLFGAFKTCRVKKRKQRHFSPKCH